MEKGPELEVYSALRGVFFFLSFFFFWITDDLLF